MHEVVISLKEIHAFIKGQKNFYFAGTYVIFSAFAWIGMTLHPLLNANSNVLKMENCKTCLNYREASLHDNLKKDCNYKYLHNLEKNKVKYYNYLS